MSSSRLTRVLLCLVATLGVVTLAVSPAGAGRPAASVLIDGLSSPKGLTLDARGNPIVSQGAFGPPGPVLRYVDHGSHRGEQEALSTPFGANAVGSVRSNGSLWILGNDGRIYRQRSLGEPPGPELVADLAAYATEHPDPYNSGEDGPADESNPFGLAVLPTGDAVVTDAAANSLLLVTPKGRVKTLARFARQLVSTDHIPAAEQPPGGFPPFIPAEAVPTGVTTDRQGNVYVGELKGFPFRPGSSHIWRIPAGVANAVCSADPAVPNRRCESWGTGFTSIASLAADRHGRLYVFEYAAAGVGVFEAQCDTAAGCPPAVLLRVRNGERTELAAGELSEPGALAVSGRDLYVTDSVLTGGRLLRLRGR